MIGLGIFVYVIIGTVITAFTSGRSLIDTVLDVLLWPLIVYYFLRWRV